MPIKTVWNRKFFPVLLTYFIDNFGLAIVYPIFTPLFLKPEFLSNAPTFLHRTVLLGLLIASFPLAQFFGAPLIGELSDQIGRKKVFIVTILGGLVGYAITGLGVFYLNLHLLWIGRALTGLFAGNLTLCLASVADITHTKGQRSRNFGWVGTIGGISFIIAIFIGGGLPSGSPFFVTAALCAINLFLMILFFKESYLGKREGKLNLLKGLKNIGAAIRTKGVRVLYASYFLFMVCWITSMQFLTAYLIKTFDVTVGVITLVFAGTGIAWSFANFVINPILSKLLAPYQTYNITILLLSVTLFLTLIPGAPLWLFISLFFVGSLCAALSWTNGLATVSLSASQYIQGSVLGVNQSVVAIASIVGPILGGIIAGVSINKLYFFTASCSLCAALMLYFKQSKTT